MKKYKKFQKYPICYEKKKLFFNILEKIKVFPFFCPICGSFSIAYFGNGQNLRESIYCLKCRGSNRNRQIAYLTCHSLEEYLLKKFSSLKKLKKQNLKIYNTEANGPVHLHMKSFLHYVCSEFLGEDLKSGTIVNGIMHQDLMNLSFEDNLFDLVLSSDVLEHVPDPYKAFQEIFRVLKKGGRHIFTIPFYQTEFFDENRAILDENKKIIFIKPALYHSDPLRPEGCLVYNIFSLEMLLKLKKIGFSTTNMYQIKSFKNGILGDNALVFESIK